MSAEPGQESSGSQAKRDPASVSAPGLLSTYLRDHHAGATAGLNLARRIASSNEGNEYGAELAQIAAEIEEDMNVLERLMEGLGVAPDQLKDLGARVGEKLGRLKPNGRWLSYSPLSRLLELDGLMLAVTGKLALWRALRETVASDLEGFDFDALAARAERQRERLEELRIRSAAQALRID
ncbi:MAG TPA: hypothetical protein VK919_12890 [Solirubrobacterales bacterium]|nr:hypothetical protein [Solirubrobacterales bacterium]